MFTSFHKFGARLTYDNVGNRLTRQTQRAEQTQETYGYDNIYQLTNVSGDQVHAYDYDPVGNREVVDATNYSANNLNQYSVVGAQSYTYDGNGNLTSDGVNTYTYDYENRLSMVSGLSSIVYEYDGFGRRISKTVGGLTTYFIYDGDQLIEERDASGGLVASYIYGTGIDEVLTMNRNAQTYYYFSDGLGSVTDITDVNGEVIESYTYDVYGNPSQNSTIGNRYMFTGREFDSETGLYHYRARAYSPSSGRFLQRDPITWGPDDGRGFTRLNNNALWRASIESKGYIAAHLLDISAIVSKNISNRLFMSGSTNPQLFHLYNYTDSVGKPSSIDYNLYHYTGNNPVNFTDPYGYIAIADDVTLLIFATIVGGFIIATQRSYPPLRNNNWIPSLEDLGIFYNMDPFNPMSGGPNFRPPWWAIPPLLAYLAKQFADILKPMPIESKSCDTKK